MKMGQDMFRKTALPLAFALGATSSTANAASQDVTVHNQTGYPIESIYVSEVGAADWGNDVMGWYTLRNGEAVHITFDRQTLACRWNLMVRYKDQTEATWTDLDFCRTTEISLLVDARSGSPIARVR